MIFADFSAKICEISSKFSKPKKKFNIQFINSFASLVPSREGGLVLVVCGLRLLVLEVQLRERLAAFLFFLRCEASEESEKDG